MSDLTALERWLDPLIANIGPGGRARMARQIATDLRRANSQRIRGNLTPDGAAMVPRQPQRIRARGGRIKRGRMFRRLGLLANLHQSHGPDRVTVEFAGGIIGRLAGLHHAGGDLPVRPGGPLAHYPARELLGIGPADLADIEQTVLTTLAEGL